MCTIPGMVARIKSDLGCCRDGARLTIQLRGDVFPCVSASPAVHVYGCSPKLLATPLHGPFGAAVDALIVPVYEHFMSSTTTVALSFGQIW